VVARVRQKGGGGRGVRTMLEEDPGERDGLRAHLEAGVVHSLRLDEVKVDAA
jgi:hypothetical protein